MYCPHCHSEYKKGIEVCSQCGVTLVLELPEESLPEFIEFKEILATFKTVEIAIIKSVLDPEGIDYYFKSEFFNTMEPLAQPARLMVRKDQADEARQILRELRA